MRNLTFTWLELSIRPSDILAVAVKWQTGVREIRFVLVCVCVCMCMCVCVCVCVCMCVCVCVCVCLCGR